MGSSGHVSLRGGCKGAVIYDVMNLTLHDGPDSGGGGCEPESSDLKYHWMVWRNELYPNIISRQK